jgi:hypothetical protein
MMMHRRIAIAALSAIVLWVGCRPSSEATVHGIVTLDGKPLSSGTVTFHSANGTLSSNGSIRSDGEYELSTGKTRGLPAGEYIATVVAYQSMNQQAATVMAMPKRITPERYGNPKTSDLKETVKPGDNPIDLVLKEKAAIRAR